MVVFRNIGILTIEWLQRSRDKIWVSVRFFHIICIFLQHLIPTLILRFSPKLRQSNISISIFIKAMIVLHSIWFPEKTWFPDKTFNIWWNQVGPINSMDCSTYGNLENLWLYYWRDASINLQLHLYLEDQHLVIFHPHKKLCYILS